MGDASCQISTLLAEGVDARHAAPETDIITLLEQVTEWHPDRDAVVSMHQRDHLDLGTFRWTFSQLREGSIRLAAQLSAKGIRRGSRVVATMLNQIEWALLFLATVRLGAHFVPLDSRLLSRKADALYIIQKVQAEGIFVSSKAMSDQVDEIMAEYPSQLVFKCIISAADQSDIPNNNNWTTLSQIMAESTHVSIPNISLRHDETILMLCTSGTTSRPKVCPHTTVTICTPALALADHLAVEPGDDLCQHLPTFHIFSIVLTLAYWLSGATVIFPSAAFDPAASFGGIRAGSRTLIPCVPSMVQAMKVYSASRDGRLPCPYTIMLGGAPVMPNVLEICVSLGAKRIVVGYGMTEGVATLLNMMDVALLPVFEEEVSLGNATAGTRVRICSLGTRQPVRRGEIGELHQGGPPVIGGYLGGSTEDNSNCYQEDGVNWCATGDQGYMDEQGQVYLLGRYKDLIIRGGENISPMKIEQCLTRLPGITAAYAVGIPDPVAGEVPVAVIQTEKGTEISVGDLQSIVLDELGRSFAPAMILDLQQDLKQVRYPTTTSGKIQKTALREWAICYLDEQRTNGVGPMDLTAELTACWSSVSGLQPDKIDPDMPICRFTDSTMLIQFLHVANQKTWRLTFRDLTTFNTIRKQVTFLEEQNKHHVEPTVTSSYRQTMQDDHTSAARKEAVTSKLRPLGLGWEDVEELIPMTDYFSNFSRDRPRPTAWNFRFTWSIQRSIDEAELRTIVELWMQRHQLLRSTTAPYSDELDMYVIMRSHPQWLKHQLIHGGEVENMDAVTQYRLNDPEYDWVNGTGPLFKVTILKTKEHPSAAGLVMHFHHVLYDGLSIIRWFQDLKDLLSNKEQHLSIFHPYQGFATNYQIYRQSRSAEEAVDFHVSRLQGISSATSALWPPQRGSRVKDPGSSSWEEERMKKLSSLDDLDKSCGMQGINRYILLPHVAKMRSLFGISPPTIAMTASALVNVRQTRATEAIFTNLLSGRSWPVGDDHQSHPTDNPLEIDGPTMTYSVQRIQIKPHETVVQLLKRVQAEQDELSIHSHAPLNQIRRKLTELGVTGAADAALMDDIHRRQSFDWLLEQYVEQDADGMKLIHDVSQSNLGLVWFPYLRNGKLLHLNVTFDDTRLSKEEVFRATTEFMCAAAWLADPSNAEKTVAECQYSGYPVEPEINLD